MSWTIVSIILLLFLVTSSALNLFFIWYGIKLIQQTRYFEEELRETVGVVNTFTNHLKSVYEMEMFYGDETLRHLLRHAQDLTDVFDQYDVDWGAETEEEESDEQ